MLLIDWYLDNELGEEHTRLSFPSHAREGMTIEMKFIKTEDKEG